MKMEQTERYETSAHKIQTPGNYPEESMQRITGTLHKTNIHFLLSLALISLE
jgi:hypothetical protein